MIQDILIILAGIIWVAMGVIGFVGIMRPDWDREKTDVGNWVFLLPLCLTFVAPLAFIWNYETAFRKPTQTDVLASMMGKAFNDMYL